MIRFIVVGLGGYGLVHIEAVRWLAGQGLAKLTGVVALEADRKRRPDLVASLRAEDCVLYDTIDQCLTAGPSAADVLTVPIGIAQHVPVSISALRAGMHVYCEKPVAATIEEVDQLIAAERETGRKVAIGYQHIYSNAIRQLKARIHDGRLGSARKITLACGWPRSRQYYQRNEWAGRMRLGSDWILDSPANNAHAHYVMNALYLCSESLHVAANPIEVRAELYRANPIEGPDTVQLGLTAAGGSRLFIVLTHANARANGPYMRVECEHGTAYWQSDDGRTMIRYRNGKSEEFDNLVHSKWRYDGFRDLVHAIREETMPLCTPGMARVQTLTVNTMHHNCPEPGAVPEEYVNEVEDWEMFPPGTKGTFRRIRGLDEYMRVAVDEWSFFSEMGIPWSHPSRANSVDTGLRFPGSVR